MVKKMSELPDYIAKGGYPKDPDLPDHVEALYVSTKNTWQDAENLDDTHGYNSYIWIPEETFAVNVMKLHVFAEKFRAYSKSAAAGGGTTVTSGASSATTTAAGGGTTVTSTSEASHKHKLGYLADGTYTPDMNMRMFDQNGGVSCLASVYRNDFIGGTDIYTYGAPTAHTHNVTLADHTHDMPHTHNVTLADHTHDIVYGIYEEAITGRTLSAKLYDPDNVLVHDFGVVTTSEQDVELNLSSYFDTLKYGMYRLELSASARIRARLVFYELCVMYAI